MTPGWNATMSDEIPWGNSAITRVGLIDVRLNFGLKFCCSISCILVLCPLEYSKWLEVTLIWPVKFIEYLINLIVIRINEPVLCLIS